MAKNNIRSIRFSDELAELIDRQTGDTFTQKFESLIYRAFWELPAKKKELEQINQRIEKQLQRLLEIQKSTEKLYTLERDIQSTINNFIRIKQRAQEITMEVEKAEM